MRLPRFLRRSVGRKVTALVVTTTLAALGLTAIALTAYNVRTYHHAKIAEVKTQAEIVGRAFAPTLEFNDPEEAARGLSMLDARPDVEQAALYTPEGQLFASYSRRDDAPSLPPHPPPELVGVVGQRLTLARPIVEGGQMKGTVVLVTTYELRSRLFAYVWILAVIMAVSLVAALILSSWLQRAVTAPILRVAAAARAVVERRDFSVRAGRTTDDETGVLADAMNHMLADLEREIQERRAAEEALLAADRRKDEFLATLAHELRNPLAPIRNALHLMELKGDDPVVAAEARAIIDRQMRQMVRLVDDLLEVSRVTTGKLELRTEPVDLANIGKAALETVEPMFRARGHQLTVSLPPPGTMIEADPTRLSQVFSNLLSNAVKFTDPGGRIELRLEVRDGEMVGRIRDDGAGIAPEMLDPIFEMFAQADKSLERTTSGLGVGLSLSRKLIELHGGTITAHSEGPGRGSEFVVRMPVRRPREQTPRDERTFAASERTAEAEGSEGPPVLVVDDNRDFATSLGHMLRSMGYEVRIEHDGLSGLAAAEAFHPRVAFLDIGMPLLNGYELAKRLRKLPATASSLLIAVTGFGQASDRERARQAGFDDHIVKPLELEHLKKILARLG